MRAVEGESQARSLPTGEVALLLTDIESSTLLWEQAPEAMAAALARHAEIVAAAVEAHGGVVVRERGEGDSTFSVFTSPADAVAAAADLQRGLHAETWPSGAELRVRAAVNAGHVLVRDGEYQPPVINRCARIREIAWGGQALVSEAAAAGLDGVTLKDLGPHRMRDLDRPLRIFQICGPGLPEDFPPLRSLDGGKQNLPVQLTTFIGRDLELDAVAKALAASRLVTLTGPGGVGKTRLALQAGARAVDAYPDGVWLAELAHIDAGDLVPRMLLDALSLREQPGRTIERTIADHLARKRALVILDNCEHVLDAAMAMSASLLRSCPEVDILATAREAVPVPGATALPVPPLELPPPGDEAEALSAVESVRLFSDRAALVRPDFSLTDDNAPVVARLCRRLEGMPLAIELAAAAVHSMSPAELEQQLSAHIALGEQEGRHGTLEAAVAWSHDLLTRDERTLFRRLAVFAGGFDLAAAEAVCSGHGLDPEDVPKLVSRLVGQSLVSAEAGERTRYRLLEVIRGFALHELAESGDGTPSRHVTYFRDLAKDLAMRLEQPEQAKMLDRLETEMPNFRAAIGRTIDDGSHAALALVAALGSFWNLRGFHTEGLEWITRAIEATGGPVTPDHGRALTGAAVLCMNFGGYQEAQGHCRESLRVWRVLGDSIGVINANLVLGGVSHRLGQVEEAEACFREAADLARRDGDERRLSGALNGVSFVALSQGRYQDALETFEEAIELARKLGFRRNLAGPLINASRAKLATGATGEAKAYLDEVLDIAREISDKVLEADTQNQLGELARDLQDLVEARRCFEECLRVCDHVHSPVTLATATTNLGTLDMLEGHHEQAIEALTDALAFWESIGQTQARSVVLENRATSRLALDQTEGAFDDLTAALELAVSIGYVPGQANALDGLADVLVRTGEPDTAARMVGASTTLFESMGRGTPDLQPHERPAIVERVRKACAGFDALVEEGRALGAADALALAHSTSATG